MVATMKELPMGFGHSGSHVWDPLSWSRKPRSVPKASSSGNNQDQRKGACRQNGHFKQRAPDFPCVRGSSA
jgi:hypothetical protein